MKQNINSGLNNTQMFDGLTKFGWNSNGTINWSHTLLNWEIIQKESERRLHRNSAQPTVKKLNIYLIDNSQSMVQSGCLAFAKSIALFEINKSYQKRNPFSIIEFGGHQAKINTPPQKGNWRNDFFIDPIQGGGGTHLQDAVNHANNLIKENKEMEVDIYLISDGFIAEIPSPPKHCNRIIIIDMENNPKHKKINQSIKIAEKWSAIYFNFFE